MLLATAACGYAVAVSDGNTEAFYLIAGGLALFGFAQGVINGPAQALLADSLRTGDRDTYSVPHHIYTCTDRCPSCSFYNYVFVCYLLGASVGPLMAVILFSYWQGYTGTPTRVFPTRRLSCSASDCALQSKATAGRCKICA